ncbi:hypothetical protein ACIG0C_22325 [Kitasatospora aureofaciens]|uniref:Uncharacterized protein n=2 Tax=Kitasatospora aureofaciens TaxID=1894 RepID=A0A8H9LY43_KITAU|nr:hypothetical protein [Kitasatospora aureofaciens]GGU97633.1 hypothetical protein GCM10010502_59880 [Kitasatospora aureofaciens]
MAARRRRRIAWGLRGTALAALLAYLPGWHASRSGGLVMVEHWLNRPRLLIGAAVVLVVLSLVVELEFRTRFSQIGCAVLLVPLVVAAVPVLSVSLVFSGHGGREDRFVSPNRSNRVLSVTNVAFSIDPVYQVELETGSGWSARHWSLGTWNTRGGDFVRIDWSGPDQITVTGRHKLTVFDVHPDGSLSEPRVLPKQSDPGAES